MPSNNQQRKSHIQNLEKHKIQETGLHNSTRLVTRCACL